MFAKLLLIALLGVVICRDVMDTEVTLEYGNFMKENNKKYDSVGEMIKRYHIFADNYRYIQNHNSQNKDFQLGVNQFSDLTLVEFKSYMLRFKMPSRKPCTVTHTKVEAKPEIDWRDKNAVTRVKNQGSCGSCWTFSTTGALEGLHAIKKGSLIEYSEQELVDCASAYGDNHGCQGGDMSQAFDYIKDNGISLESEYPYVGRNGQCRKKSNSFQVAGCVNVTADDSMELLEALNIGPVSIAVKADNRAFMYYRGGIITSGCGSDRDELDHGITLVGAGIDKSTGTPYWIAKNSWGSSWGEHGFVRIKRDTVKGHGMCGIAMENCYPTL